MSIPIERNLILSRKRSACYLLKSDGNIYYWEMVGPRKPGIKNIVMGGICLRTLVMPRAPQTIATIYLPQYFLFKEEDLK